MQEILKQITNFITNQKRPELINAKIYGQYSQKEQSFLYDDSQKNI